MSEDTPPKAYTEEEYERNVAAIKDMRITENEEEIRRALRQTSNDVDVREGGRGREREGGRGRERERGREGERGRERERERERGRWGLCFIQGVREI